MTRQTHINLTVLTGQRGEEVPHLLYQHLLSALHLVDGIHYSRTLLELLRHLLHRLQRFVLLFHSFVESISLLLKTTHLVTARDNGGGGGRER
jgi:hypothetical protein